MFLKKDRCKANVIIEEGLQRKLFRKLLIVTALLLIQQVPNSLTILQDDIPSPTFIKDMDLSTVRENTPVGELVYTLEARVDSHQQQTKIWYSIEGTQLFSVDKFTGQVRVAQPIDREQTSDAIAFKVKATAVFNVSPNQVPKFEPGPTILVPITVLILDENDNAPKVDYVRVGSKEYDEQQLNSGGPQRGVPIVKLNFSETTRVQSAIVDLIRASDVDKVSQDPLRATCINCEPEFELTLTENDGSLNDQMNASIKLVRPLVHIPRNNIRQFQVVVNDGKFNSSIFFELTIGDVQNRGPQFIGSTTCVIQENTPIDRVIMTVQAVDGDAVGIDELPSSVSLAEGSLTGSNGRPIIYDLIHPLTGSYSSSTNEFKLHPLTGQLQVSDRIDRESHSAMSGILSFKVRARELTLSPSRSIRQDDSYDSILDQLAPFIDQSAVAETELTVILVDVNDNAPRWLNSSEISAMNMGASSDWFSNLPSDHNMGRDYNLQVRENSLPGTPITTKNEIFVYDLDSGQNAIFNLSVEDPFGLFEVEPKQVSGFSMVTLKLAGGETNKRRFQQHRLFDYEDPNEKSYIIQLVATETRTSEGFASKSNVKISVIDVNDNAPEFKEPAYIANIREDSQPGKSVLLVQAFDRDEVSQNLFYSIHGKTAHMFEINNQTGLITVAKCDHPAPISSGRHRQSVTNSMPKSCLDYEAQRSHHLLVEVSDQEFSRKVPLTIFIDDVSDNPPIFTLPIVDVVIEEGTEIISPSIRIEATDLDQTSMITYSIVEGNFGGLFSINNITGELQLTRPIRIANEDGLTKPDIMGDSSQQLNKMILVVQATDGVYHTNCTVRVDILDANDNAPKFLRNQYQAEIPEFVSAGYPVVTVRAIDSDRGNNARVSYRIERGSFNQFEIDQSKGLISVSRQAEEFDSAKRENYTLEIIAYDHGLNSKSSSVIVNIRVLDSLKAAPRFEPHIQRTSVQENTLNNTIIHRMSVANLDELANQALVFEPGPIEALDRNGQLVSSSESERLESMFSVSKNTGDVMVNSALDHDFAAFVNLTIYVSRKQDSLSTNISLTGEDSTAREFNPRSVGYLTINVVDDNNNAPIFAAPWSPMQTELSFQMLEELPIGSILTQLVATDADSKISHYKIEPSNEYFELVSPQSGVIVNKKQIDYDALMSQTFLRPGAHRSSSPKSSVGNNIIQFNVYVYDFGVPQLSAKATVSVEILPVNDHDCKFEQQLYEVTIKENSLMDTLVAQVRANDLDYGEYNLVKYQLLGEHSDLFQIDQRSGLITVSKNGSAYLDRERLNGSTVMLTVLGYDGDQSIHVDDQSSVSSLSRATRKNQNDINQSRTCSAVVKVQISDVNDNPPLFLKRVYEVTAYDTDSSDVPLIRLLVRDDDSSSNSAQPSGAKQPTNSFKIVSGNTNNSFNITDSGLLYTTKALASSQSGSDSDLTFHLKIQVRQQTLSLASFTDECLVIVHRVKINRFGPEWRFDTSKQISVEENSKPGTFVTQLRCFDRDWDQVQDLRQQRNATQAAQPMRYFLKNNGSNVDETQEFKVDPISGNLYTKVEFDREVSEFRHLLVVCEDNGRPQSLSSVASIYVHIRDMDDNKPEFVLPPSLNPRSSLMNQPSEESLKGQERGMSSSRPTLVFTVEEQQSRGLQVGELQAIDPDIQNSRPVNYCIIDGNEFEEFYLDKNKGILYTNQTLDREKQASYELLVKAINDGSNCRDHMVIEYGVQPESNNSLNRSNRKTGHETDTISIRIDVSDINDSEPTFQQLVHRAGVHYRSLLNTLVTQVAAYDPDSGLNGTVSYKISEISSYRKALNADNSANSIYQHHHSAHHAKQIRLMQFPFRIDQQGNIYTQQLLTQYPLMSMFIIQIEATEQAEPWRTARTKLEVYPYEMSNQLKMRIHLHPRFVDTHRFDIEQLLSNATNYTAIINRARNYYGVDSASQVSDLTKSVDFQSQSASNRGAASHNSGVFDDSSSFSATTSTNIHLIFVDNFSIVNPNLVMEKFDLTSAQLFIPQHLAAQFTSLNGGNKQTDVSKTNGQDHQPQELRIHEISSFIDKIALASMQSSDSSYNSPGSFLNVVDWLENPSVIHVVLTVALFVIGFFIFIFGCCCGSRIKDHIIKTAMNKLVQQQNMQARINERMLAAANGTLAARSERLPTNDHDFINSQAGLMSSFDATKGCINNNNENMGILQRALDPGEFVDHSYNTINGHHNFGAHYYDTSELDQHPNSDVRKAKQLEESISLVDEPDCIANGRDYNGSHPSSKQLGEEGLQHGNQRPRQQIPK